MLSVKGRFQSGAAQPTEPIQGHEGDLVLLRSWMESVLL